MQQCNNRHPKDRVSRDSQEKRFRATATTRWATSWSKTYGEFQAGPIWVRSGATPHAGVASWKHCWAVLTILRLLPGIRGLPRLQERFLRDSQGVAPMPPLSQENMPCSLFNMLWTTSKNQENNRYLAMVWLCCFCKSFPSNYSKHVPGYLYLLQACIEPTQ